MTNLTEKWKKGELEFGKEYYVRFEDGEIDTALWCFYTNQNKYGFNVDGVKEVLEEVPSYEKWEKFRNRFSDYQIENSNLLIENTKLKGLLRECKERLIYCTISTHDVQAKINQVLGEE